MGGKQAGDQMTRDRQRSAFAMEVCRDHRHILKVGDEPGRSAFKKICSETIKLTLEFNSFNWIIIPGVEGINGYLERVFLVACNCHFDLQMSG